MKKTYIFLLALFGLHLFLLVSLRFTAWPEMFSFAYLANNGFLLYRDFVQPYPPLLTIVLGLLYRFFGYQLWVLQTFAWLVILLNGLLVFLVVRKATQKENAALVALGLYVFLQPFLEGNMLWLDLAIVPPILAALLFLLTGTGKRNLLVAGLFLAVATLIKQTGVLFLGLAILYLVARRVEIRKLLYFLAGPAVLALLLVAYLLQKGIWQDFLNWTVVFPATYWTNFPGYVQMALSAREAAIMILLFLPILFLIFKKRGVFQEKKFQLILLFLLGGVVSVYPRFSFFHFQAALAFLVVVYGFIFARRGRASLWAALALIVLAAALIQRPVFNRDWQKEARFWGSEDLQLAKTVSERVPPGERVFLLGPHSGLYVAADRLPPKPWADNFGWYWETPSVQEEILERWQEDLPQVVFWQEPEPGNWFDLGTYQPKKIAEFIEGNYTKKQEVKPGVWLWQRE